MLSEEDHGKLQNILGIAQHTATAHTSTSTSTTTGGETVTSHTSISLQAAPATRQHSLSFNSCTRSHCSIVPAAHSMPMRMGGISLPSFSFPLRLPVSVPVSRCQCCCCLLLFAVVPPHLGLGLIHTLVPAQHHHTPATSHALTTTRQHKPTTKQQSNKATKQHTQQQASHPAHHSTPLHSQPAISPVCLPAVSTQLPLSLSLSLSSSVVPAASDQHQMFVPGPARPAPPVPLPSSSALVPLVPPYCRSLE